MPLARSPQDFPASILNLPNDARMLDAIRAGLSWADEARFAIAFTRCSGLQLLLNDIQELQERGGRVQLLTSTYQHITQPEALSALLQLKDVECRVQQGPTGFHTKFWWFRGDQGGECWAGSSNLTKGGLATNLEWNLRTIDPSHCDVTRGQFEQLWNRTDVVPLTSSFVDRYRAHRREERESQALPMAADLPVEAFAPNGAQREALTKLAEARRLGQRRAAVIAATGLGKTFLAAFDVLASGARNVLYVSHRLEHLHQAERTFARVLPERSRGLVGAGYQRRDAEIVFATIQSLQRATELKKRRWDYVVIDEFHHAESPSYQVLRELIGKAFLLGMTATPERQDGHDVLEWCDWNVAYEVRLNEAIERKWLRPFHYFGIADLTVDFAKIPWRGRVPIEVLERELSIDARADLVLKQALLHGFDGPKRVTVGFCASVRHAQFMAEAFRRRGQNAVAIDGTLPVEQREQIYVDLQNPNHPLEWLFVSDLLNEGVDIPAINSVLFLRPTESAALFLQQLGRGLRLSPSTEVLTVLDFVGHHRSSWVTLQALHDAGGTGARVEVDGLTIKPPRSCEVVLERRTLEILQKVARYTSKRDACRDAYRELKEELGRPPLPVDLWDRQNLPPLKDFRQAFKSWLKCQRAMGDEPSWARNLDDEHPACVLLAKAEADWQAQRVTPYALLWGTAAQPEDPAAGYEEFFARYRQWQVEYVPLAASKAAESMRRKIPAALFDGDRFVPEIHDALGAELLREVEGRLLHAANDDFKERHGGVLRTPADLSLYSPYGRPEIVRHFGTQYDPARHNAGILWFENQGVIITKLDTSGAVESQQYVNEFLTNRRFSWTSQNRMTPANSAGRRVLEHRANGAKLHLFVQPRSHEPALYLGTVDVVGFEGSGPMRVTLEMARALPANARKDLGMEEGLASVAR